MHVDLLSDSETGGEWRDREVNAIGEPFHN